MQTTKAPKRKYFTKQQKLKILEELKTSRMAESFVRTFKRDYVYVSDCNNAETVINLLPDWVVNYNSEAPHSGLNIMSPLEYR